MPADRSTASSEDHPVRSESIVTDIQTIYFLIVRARTRCPAAAGSRRVGGRSGSQSSLHLPSPSTCARPRATRLDRARTPKSSTEEAAAAAATEATCARHRRHATVCSSASLRSPWGRRRFDAAGVSNTAPTGTVHGGSMGGSGCLAARTDAGPAAACAAGLRPPPIRPAAWEASVGGVRGFRSPGPGACVPRASSRSLRARAPRVRSHRFTTQLYPSLHSNIY